MKPLLAVILLAWLPSLSLGQTCPLGVSHDPHPGQCGAYRDADSDSICDLSQAGSPSAGQVSTAPGKPSHHLWQIFLGVGLLAAATELLILRQRCLAFRLQTVWNWLLLLAFVLSSLTGLYFILPLSWRPVLGFDPSHWHTETGLAFIAVGAYHAVRRFYCMVRGLKGCFSGR